MKFFNRLKNMTKSIHDFINASKNEIANSNIEILKIASVATVILVTLFLCITPLIFKGWHPSKEYFIVFPIAIIFFVFSIIYSKNKNKNCKLVSILCHAFYILILACLIIIDVFPDPNSPQAFVASYFMVMAVLFLLKPLYVGIIMLIGEILFLILAYNFKSTNMFRYDLFNTIVSLTFAFVIEFIITFIRSKDYEQKRNFKQKSMVDYLTNIYNKKTIEDICKKYLSKKETEENLAFAIFDIDNFKNINDTYGHIKGDEILSLVGENLNLIFKGKAQYGRIGGDEFCIFIKNTSDKKMVKNYLNSLQKEIETSVFAKVNIRVSCSIGVIITKLDNYERIYSLADMELYEAKHNGKNCSSINESIT